MLICEYHPEQVYVAVKTFGLKDPALDPWIARANKKCARSLRDNPFPVPRERSAGRRATAP